MDAEAKKPAICKCGHGKGYHDERGCVQIDLKGRDCECKEFRQAQLIA